MGLPLPPPGDLPDPGIKLSSPAWQADSLPLNHLGSPNGVYLYTYTHTHNHMDFLKRYIFNSLYLIYLKKKVFLGIKYS